MNHFHLVLLSLASCLSLANGPAPTRVSGPVVGPVSKPPYESGVVSTYATVTVAYDGGKAMTIFWPYLAVGQFSPHEREFCRFEFRNTHLAGLVGSTYIYLNRAPVLTSIRCKSGCWSERSQRY
jgi:hypothetical protein